MSLTRRALFEGRTDEAKKYVALADSGFNKAKTDNTVYTKAEADLKAPGAKAGAAEATSGADAPSAADMKKPVAWVPINESITIMEDITGNKAKTAAVADANESLLKGDKAGATQKLKVAGFEVAVTVAVMPINSTIDKVHKAAELIDAGKYYEDGQQLRLARPTSVSTRWATWARPRSYLSTGPASNIGNWGLAPAALSPKSAALIFDALAPRHERCDGRSFRHWEGNMDPFCWTSEHRAPWLIVSLGSAVAAVLFAYINSPFFFDPRGWSSFASWMVSPGLYWKRPPAGFFVTASLFYFAQLFRASN